MFGTPAEIIERLRALERAGVGYVLVSDPSGNLDALRVFAEEVMPAMRTAAGSAGGVEAANLMTHAA